MIDIIILGSGPAGLTAAIYGARANKDVLVLGGDVLGGQMSEIAQLENYPGFAGSGLTLAEFMKNQAESFGAKFKAESCVKLEWRDSHWHVKSDKSEYEAKTVVIATGARPRKLDIESAREFVGKGVSYCATCDGFFYGGKTVAVYGGGNAALTDALYLANIAKKVYIIYRKKSFTRAEAILVKRAENVPNIERIFSTEIAQICGSESGVTHIITKSANGETKIPVDGLFVAIGHEANTDFLSEDHFRDDLGRLVPAPNSAAIAQGLFVAGDVRSHCKMQICVATGWGCEAATDAVAYLNKS